MRQFWNDLGSGSKFLLKCIPIGLILFVAYLYLIDRLPYKEIIASAVPKSMSLSEKEVGNNKASSTEIALPSGRPMARNTSKEMRVLSMQWNGQLAFFLANGGPVTLSDSMIGKFGGYVRITNENDTGQMQNQLFAFAKAWADNGGKGNPETGAHAVIVMGDGGPAYINSWNKGLRKFCKDNKILEKQCEAVATGAVGSSYGEDKLMGPVEWKNNPHTALGKNTKRGGLIAAYLWDGNHMEALWWAQANGLKVNPDDRTWDPDALNFFNPKDFLDAVEKYLTGYCEDRPEVQNGKPTGKKVNVCVEGVATWTPGDMNIAKSQKDTLVTLVSTRELRNQMAATVITIRGWAQENASTLAAIYAGTSKAADMIKTSDVALQKAAQVAVQVYGNKGFTADEWARLYKGIPHRTKNGYDIVLGGSRVWNLADMMDYYGLTSGNSIYQAVYEQYGNMVKDMAPDIIPTLQPIEEVVDTTYIEMAHKLVGSDVGKADVPTYQSSNPVSEVVGSANFTINFDTGSEYVRADSVSTVRKIYQQIATTGLRVQIVGHTDNVGNPDFNRDLSLRRATSVRNEIIKLGGSGKYFSEARFGVEGKGQDQPLNPNMNQNLPLVRAQNRRVEIILGN